MFTQLLRTPTGIHPTTSLPCTQGHLPIGTNQRRRLGYWDHRKSQIGLRPSTMPRWHHQALGISLLLPVWGHMKGLMSSDGWITCPGTTQTATPSALSQLSRNAPRSRRRSLMPPGTSGNRREVELTWLTCGKGTSPQEILEFVDDRPLENGWKRRHSSIPWLCAFTIE